MTDGLVDRVVAVLAVLTAIRPILRGALGQRSHLSWKRGLALLVGGGSALVGAVGLLALRRLLLDEPFYLPTWTGGTLAVTGGVLGLATLLANRGPQGLSEDEAIRSATQALAMSVYVAAPVLTLAALGAARLARAAIPWTVSQARWVRLLEGVFLLALCAVPREVTLGGLRAPWSFG